MKLLTLNFLTCARKSCRASPTAFPLHPRNATLEISEVDLNPQFLTNLLPRLDWPALCTVARELGLPGLTEETPSAAGLWMKHGSGGGGGGGGAIGDDEEDEEDAGKLLGALAKQREQRRTTSAKTARVDSPLAPALEKGSTAPAVGALATSMTSLASSSSPSAAAVAAAAENNSIGRISRTSTLQPPLSMGSLAYQGGETQDSQDPESEQRPGGFGNPRRTSGKAGELSTSYVLSQDMHACEYALDSESQAMTQSSFLEDDGSDHPDKEAKNHSDDDDDADDNDDDDEDTDMKQAADNDIDAEQEGMDLDLREPSLLARNLHRVLMETCLKEGQLVCGNCGHEYAVKEGIPNFLLPPHMV